MAKRMLIDATHAEETRVVVLDGNRLEDFDVETSAKRHLKGNIYLAKVVRVEPSLQAAFVEYGGNRHGFLAFSEIHPDYYQIPVADRQHLLDMQAEEARRQEEEEDRAAEAAGGIGVAKEETPAEGEPHSFAEEERSEPVPQLLQPPAAESPEAQSGADDPMAISIPAGDAVLATPETSNAGRAEPNEPGQEIAAADEPAPLSAQPSTILIERLAAPAEPADPVEAQVEIRQTDGAPEPGGLATSTGEPALAEPPAGDERDAGATSADGAHEGPYEADGNGYSVPETPPPETVGGDQDAVEESRERRIPPRFLRNYKIQEVIKRRQILLVQVVKEERGTKGAALTTYLSLAGRYCVLMPNSPRGGGISRKITSAADRRRLKDVIAELDLPSGMGLIVRTAGANRPKPEIKRDCEYLLRLWDDIREHTLRSVAPALIYEEASLIKRAIRDVYSRDIDEIIVDGEEGWRAARDFMRMLMPSHAKKVQLWRDGAPLFARHQVDAQLDAVLSPTVQLRSGGYLVINQTEALVAIDVNSGRSTRERGIEETALRTNLEAAEEVARELRLRDLAGLIVIDFIDMESKKHNAMVERRLKEALKNDRARLQVGHISHFGLLEMSRQRLRPSLAETSFILCPHCGGTGHLRSTESAAIHVLRGIEEEGAKRRAAEVVVHVAMPIAMYVLNYKRERLGEIEARYGMRASFAADDTMIAPQFRIERVRALAPAEASAIRPEAGRAGPPATSEERASDEDVDIDDDDDATEDAEELAEVAQGEPGTESAEEAERRRRRRRRRRRGGRRDEAEVATEPTPAEPEATGSDREAGSLSDDAGVEGVPERENAGASDDVASGQGSGPGEEEERGRRRGRRGGRRRRRGDEVLPEIAAPGAEQPDLPPIYAGPTPADPFGGQGFDIFEVLEQAEQQATISGAASSASPLPVMIEPFVAPEPVPDITPEPGTTGTAMTDPLDSEASATEPGASAPPETVSAPLSQPEPPEPPAPANDPAPPEPPVIQPIVIGAEEAPPATRKRGWWRR